MNLYRAKIRYHGISPLPTERPTVLWIVVPDPTKAASKADTVAKENRGDVVSVTLIATDVIVEGAT